MHTCKYRLSWRGPCGQPTAGEDCCPEHATRLCTQCGAPATHECDITLGAFVCGCTLCAKCDHIYDGATGYDGTILSAEGVTRKYEQLEAAGAEKPWELFSIRTTSGVWMKPSWKLNPEFGLAIAFDGRRKAHLHPSRQLELLKMDNADKTN